jgi:uncharacterized protein
MPRTNATIATSLARRVKNILSPPRRRFTGVDPISLLEFLTYCGQTEGGRELAKHGVSFEQARTAFSDPFAIDFFDDRQNYDEERLVLFGMADSRLLVVVHTWRGDTIRIISAREAEPHERRRYHEENSQDR